MVLTGRYDYTLDSKNRLVVPPTFRDLLTQEKGTHFMLAQGFDGDLWLFLPSQWEQYQNHMNEAAKGMKDKAAARAAMMQFFSSAERVELDEQGRILVPESLKAHAQLKKDVVVAGAGAKAAIWSSDRYEQHVRKQAKPALEMLAKELGI
ncbi:MAG: division/cell wall cluster transcriptional repressor MraZ [Elusimicrobia bacterium]|nr:division/cell wall cluster transcriptional repressor MraZ [Elusimicrobiota bacterium]